ncbi:biopolymer transport protein ExbB [mine drainage metagenome]|uniref:Biopolymer transport protein ExbB n=1 Tax=mine drainage metagenome TaxID=410659 RepID=A0A1J5TF10_9ZZZZ
MQDGYEFNGLGFIVAGGLVSIGVAVALLIMSVASWYLIVTKSLHAWHMRAAFKLFTQKFWSSPSLVLAKQDHAIALANFAKQSIAAAEHHQLHVMKSVEVMGNDVISRDEFVARAMNRSLAEESAKLESGLTVLASVGSVSPFVGLFGTVWGIYHALAGISQSGQASLDKVAGPVGEALIMTALGLAVAIPAVLAYNGLVRSNRVLVSQIESFGFELHTLLTTGAVIQFQAEPVKAHAQEVKSSLRGIEVPA